MTATSQLQAIHSLPLHTLQLALAQKTRQQRLKRLIDILSSLLLITLLSPLLVVTALAIKLLSRGPILYSNDRVGFEGYLFRCYKFRTMVIDQSTVIRDHEDALESQKAGVLHKQKNDHRVTRVGKLLRKTSIDELPQLFNVLKGDMSLVGPRPLVPFMLTHYPEFRRVRCLVKPGITGLWQIRERDKNTSALFMFTHDIEYVQQFSLLLDLKILVSTPVVVLSGKGAF